MITRLLTVFFFFVAVPVFSAQSDFFMVTDAGTSAQMIRRGNVEGYSDLASSVFENPASMYRTRQFETSIFQTTFMEEVTYRNAAVTMRMPVGVIGMGYMSAGVDDIARTYEKQVGNDTEAAVEGYFSYKNNLAKIAYQVSQSDSLHFGLAYTYYWMTMDTVRGEGYNMDLGIHVDQDRLDFSVVVRNMMTSSKINYTDSTTDLSNTSAGQVEGLPLQTIYSLRYSFNEVQFYSQMKTVGRDRKFVRSLGLEYRPNFLRFFTISGSYKQNLFTSSIEGVSQREIVGSITAGIGLDLYGVKFDYAYENSEHVLYPHKHYFSMGLSF